MSFLIEMNGYSNLSVDSFWKHLENGWIFKCAGADEVNLDFVEGGAYKVQWKFGGFGKGYFLKIERHSKLLMSWSTLPKEHSQFPAAIDTLLSLQLFQDKNGTRVCLRHSNFDEKESFEDNKMGWESIFQRLLNPSLSQ